MVNAILDTIQEQINVNVNERMEPCKNYIRVDYEDAYQKNENMK